ncbi:hypothetical protein BpHYR1_036417 [Brachionus plicatilis]|uniref:Uncharacterized protein n=1 Tax=Brachionus plicatilis TaxID=10195 RepID=A0A3M7SJG5_BRAPC|nr:hypothetical protein BpHYR1_036417 [Brachionus plicatilis]
MRSLVFYQKKVVVYVVRVVCVVTVESVHDFKKYNNFYDQIPKNIYRWVNYSLEHIDHFVHTVLCNTNDKL